MFWTLFFIFTQVSIIKSNLKKFKIDNFFFHSTMSKTCVVELQGKKQKWLVQRLVGIFKGENNKFDKV